MAKKEKVQLTPEEIAAKKLKRKKGWARVGAVALAVVITGAVYVLGSKDGPKVVQEVEDPPIIQQIVQQTPSPSPAPAPAAPTTKAAAPTTKAPETTTKTATPTTTAANNGGSSGGGGILDTITGLLGGLGDFDIGSLLGGIGGGDGGGLGGLVDRNSAADTIEGAGTKAKDFFYGLADNVEENEGLDDINDQLRDKIGGATGGSGSSDSGSSGLGGITDGLSGITDGIDLGGLGDTLGGLTGGGDGGDVLGGLKDTLGGLLGGLGG